VKYSVVRDPVKNSAQQQELALEIMWAVLSNRSWITTFILPATLRHYLAVRLAQCHSTPAISA
jgi:hypothetical protein